MSRSIGENLKKSYFIFSNYLPLQIWTLKRSVDSMADIRLIFGRPEHRCQASSAVKMQFGDSLMSYEEMNVKIFKKCCLIG